MDNFNLEDYIDFDSLDFLAKYAIIITNFMIIIFLLVYNKFFKKIQEGNPENIKHHILIIISNPKDLTT